MRNPFAWEGLKRALMSGEVVIENPGEQGAPLPTTRPRPEPIPLDLKVILIGPAALYKTLHQVDVEFPELFGVKAEFAPDMDWNEENLASYSAFLSRIVHNRGLLHFDRSAVARIVEHGARLRDHQRKLTTRFLDIARLAVEASHWAGKAGHEVVLADDVDAAIAQQERRRNLAEERTASPPPSACPPRPSCARSQTPGRCWRPSSSSDRRPDSSPCWSGRRRTPG